MNRLPAVSRPSRGHESEGGSPVARRRDEDHIQHALARILDAANLWWAHSPNEALGELPTHRAAQFVGLGVKTGLQDILVFDTPPLHPTAKGFALEVKTLTGSESSDQKRWRRELTQRGWVCRVGKGLARCVEILADEAGYASVRLAIAWLEAQGFVVVGDRLERVKGMS